MIRLLLISIVCVLSLVACNSSKEAPPASTEELVSSPEMAGTPLENLVVEEPTSEDEPSTSTEIPKSDASDSVSSGAVASAPPPMMRPSRQTAEPKKEENSTGTLVKNDAYIGPDGVETIPRLERAPIQIPPHDMMGESDASLVANLFYIFSDIPYQKDLRGARTIQKMEIQRILEPDVVLSNTPSHVSLFENYTLGERVTEKNEEVWTLLEAEVDGSDEVIYFIGGHYEGHKENHKLQLISFSLEPKERGLITGVTCEISKEERSLPFTIHRLNNLMDEKECGPIFENGNSAISEKHGQFRIVRGIQVRILRKP